MIFSKIFFQQINIDSWGQERNLRIDLFEGTMPNDVRLADAVTAATGGINITTLVNNAKADGSTHLVSHVMASKKGIAFNSDGTNVVELRGERPDIDTEGLAQWFVLSNYVTAAESDGVIIGTIGEVGSGADLEIEGANITEAEGLVFYNDLILNF